MIFNLFYRRHVKVGESWREIMVRRPLVVDEYNIYMRGVDKGDQLINLYNVLIKSLRWWKTLFFHMIDIAIVNSSSCSLRCRNSIQT